MLVADSFRTSYGDNNILIITDLAVRLQLNGRTMRNRCVEQFIRSEFDRFIDLFMAETLVSMVPETHCTGSSGDETLLSEHIAFAIKTLRDRHTDWFLEEGDGDDQSDLAFFQLLARSASRDIRFRVSAKVEEFWASQELLEDGGFMRYLARARIHPVIPR